MFFLGSYDPIKEGRKRLYEWIGKQPLTWFNPNQCSSVRGKDFRITWSGPYAEPVPIIATKPRGRAPVHHATYRTLWNLNISWKQPGTNLRWNASLRHTCQGPIDASAIRSAAQDAARSYAACRSTRNQLQPYC